MQTSENVLFVDSRDREQNEELIGVLNAIAIVSKTARSFFMKYP